MNGSNDASGQVANFKWWKPSLFPPEPQRLLHLLLLGVAYTFIGYFAAAAVAILLGLWSPVSPPSGEPWGWPSECHRQLQQRDEGYRNIALALQTCQARRSVFTGALKDADSPFYSDSPKMLQEENQRIKQLEEQRKLSQVKSVKQDLLPPVLLVYLALMSMLAFAAGRLMLLHGKHALPKVEEISESSIWERSYWTWVLIPFVFTVIRELLTSVFVVTKSAFGYTSFCICTEAWLFQLLLEFGTHMVIAYPACIAWCLSGSSHLPDPKNFEWNASDGAWGVRDHILFVQTWSILSIVLLIPSTLLWAKFAAERSREYLIQPIVLLLGSLILVGRLIYRAMQVRLMYLRKVDSLGNWSEIKKLDLPSDPTAVFLGERWWSLPATLIAALTTMWAIGKFVLELIR